MGSSPSELFILQQFEAMYLESQHLVMQLFEVGLVAQL